MKKNCSNCTYWDEKHKSMQSNRTHFSKCLWELHESQMPESLLHQEIHTAYIMKMVVMIAQHFRSENECLFN